MISFRSLRSAGSFAVAGLIFSLLSCSPLFGSLAGRKIGIDPGHGAGVNQGVVIAEGTWVLDASLRARTHFQNDGATVVMTRTTGADPALATRANIANSNNVHQLLVVHSNAAGASAQGIEAIWCDQNPSPNASKNLADRLRIRALNMVHNANRATKECLQVGRGFHFYMIRSVVNMPASLPEYYFHTNPWENQNIHNTAAGRENVAKSMYAAVCDIYGVTPSFEPPVPPSTTFAAGDWVKTTADPTLNLRAGPSTADEILTALPVGTLARVRDHANNGIHANSNSWWYVEVHPGGERGWLAEFYLEKTEGPGDPSVDLIIDNSSPGFSVSASWGSATWAADKFGADYRFRAVEAISDRASWTAELPFAGSYQVYAWWSSASDRSQSAPYTVAHAGGDQLVRVNQREGGGQWNLLGTYDFSAGPAHVYLSCWTSNSGSDVVIADAVRFVTFDEPPPVVYRALAIEIDGDGSVLQTPQADEYADGTMVQFQAVPGEGYAFLEWSGDLSSAQNPLNLIIDRDYSLVARFGRTYAAWVQQYFSPEERANPNVSGELASPAGDGISNLLKYALGLDPKQTYAGAAPSLERTGEGTSAHLTLAFSRPTGVSDIDYLVELSDEPDGLWAERAELVSEHEIDGIITAVYRDPASIDAVDRRFIRLRVTRN